MKMRDKIENGEKTFHYRSYGKGELAMLYIPHVLQQSAVDQFNKWIKAYPGLKERLEETGLTTYSKRYTPAQVRILTEAFEEP